MRPWMACSRNSGSSCPGGFLRSLTDEQRAAVKEKVSSLRAEGATDEEIQAAVNTLFEELGVEPPEGWQFRSRRSRGLLSDEQRTAVKERIDALKAEGATDEEIRAAGGVRSRNSGSSVLRGVDSAASSVGL